MSEFLNNPAFKRDLSNASAKPWRLDEPLRYRSTNLGYTLTVPAGYCTDMATIPWVFRRVLPQDGPYSLAAVLHDYLVDKRYADIDSARAALIFLEAMEVLNVPAWKRKVMYYAVRFFGPKWDHVTEANNGSR